MEYICIIHIHIHPPFVFRAVLILRGIDSTRCWKHCSEILVHIVMIASHSCCRFVVCTSMMWISRSSTSQGALLDWDLVTVEAIWVKWTHRHVQETSLRWFELCDGALSCWKYIRRWERHPVWSSAAGAHLLQGSTCCVFKDGRRVAIWVTVVFLSSLTSLSILLWPLTSTRHFRPHNCRSLDIFLFFGPFSVNPRDGLCVKNPVNQQFLKYLLSCCHVIGWLAICGYQANKTMYLIKWPVSVYIFH